MTTQSESNNLTPHGSLLGKCAVAAFILEASLLTLMGWQKHWLAHPHSKSLDTTQFVEAQIFEPPAEPYLVKKKETAPILEAKPEPALSKTPAQGKASPLPQQSHEEENQTKSGTEMTPTHGPVAVFAPPPVIPSYLQNREFKTAVAIDFYVNMKGGVITKLVGPSGSDELDAIALESVKKWIFRPAEKDHQAIDSKVRLRIVFTVN
jgi:TonB family protein